MVTVIDTVHNLKYRSIRLIKYYLQETFYVLTISKVQFLSIFIVLYTNKLGFLRLLIQ